jgi:hypothetical protein
VIDQTDLPGGIESCHLRTHVIADDFNGREINLDSVD